MGGGSGAVEWRKGGRKFQNDKNCVDVWRSGGLDVIRKEAWPFYRKISGVRL